VKNLLPFGGFQIQIILYKLNYKTSTPSGTIFTMGVIVKFVESIRWYPRGMSAEERRLVFKVDCPVLIYACLSFFTRYLDVSALSKLRTALSLINISKFGASANTKTTQPKTPMFLE